MDAAGPAEMKPRTTPYEIAAWTILALGLFFTLYHHLLAALLAGLIVYSTVHRISGHLGHLKMEGQKAKWVAVGIISLILVGVSTGIVLGLIALVRGGLPELMEKMTAILKSLKVWFTTKGIGEWIPEPEKAHERIVEWFEKNTEKLKEIGGLTVGIMIHAIVGIVIGAMLSFHTEPPAGPLSAAIFERVRRFANAFEAVIFAQIKISALNTLFTAIYLLIVLPLCGVELPLRKSLVLVTFIAGLVPVVGNLVSNSVIVFISLGVGAPVAIASLIFLIVIHKLEYFLNAKIVGGEIHAAAWEILLAMICFEAAFGIPGVIVAPIVYAYLKTELKDKQLILGSGLHGFMLQRT